MTPYSDSRLRSLRPCRGSAPQLGPLPTFSPRYTFHSSSGSQPVPVSPGQVWFLCQIYPAHGHKDDRPGGKGQTAERKGCRLCSGPGCGQASSAGARCWALTAPPSPWAGHLSLKVLAGVAFLPMLPPSRAGCPRSSPPPVGAP